MTTMDNYTKQLEQCYNNMFGIVMKLVTGPKENVQRVSAELGSKMDEFETICDELCHIIEYNKQRLQANVIVGIDDQPIPKTNAEISHILSNKLETTKRLKQLLEDFTKELQPQF